jgi:hypothetical protein
MRRKIIVLMVTLVATRSIWAQAPPATVDIRKPPPISELPDGRIVVGNVTIDRTKRTATFPAHGCLAEGAVEYLLVHETGKTHEAVLKTTTEPFHLHTAMLLLGAKPPKPTDAQGDASHAPAHIDDEFLVNSKRPEGPSILISVAWSSDGAEHKHSASELVLNTETGASPPADQWVYNGSALSRGEFFAQSTGSMISIVTDPDALANFIGDGRTRDEIWKVASSNAPLRDQPLTVTITVIATTTEPAK